MNTNRDIVKRLLRLYPIKELKEWFKETGAASDVIEVVSARPKADLYSFCFEHVVSAKQHIYLFESQQALKESLLDDLPYDVVKKSNNKKAFSALILPETTYSVYLSNPLEEAQVRFLHPVLIRAEGTNLAIHFIKLEKNVKPYFDASRNAAKSGQSTSERDILNQIIESIHASYDLEPIDFNKGIKAIWDCGDIDSSKVQYRKDSSVTTDTMDELLLFKVQYPEEYKQIISKPLVKTYFRATAEDEKFCETFDVEPGDGFINIPRYPKTPKQVVNVIDEILKNN